VNTKADIRFAVNKADFLPAWVKRNLLEQERNRMNTEGELVVNSSRHRTQK
jgi:peptidyl-tRNA hydrolase ICT1